MTVSTAGLGILGAGLALLGSMTLLGFAEEIRLKIRKQIASIGLFLILVGFFFFLVFQKVEAAGGDPTESPTQKPAKAAFWPLRSENRWPTTLPVKRLPAKS
ncbi:MAG: hypothetical protein COV31_03055 [Candidatus Yanofskybacteria bacterium CG10_big_fil_rev_8_21_14_0_10_46_23]|uniref:Uncharacterized protein n=1 Tax=Candidatus Yanofskybacteria bacterium CG10_big_fil_rev_8_21_14_0_10_46_23 TaxID=1975098 RepID=A0A2H0R4Z5_9BACT|nr:MAG: hypothetical protein COV31_03055 [Candidatus Yanofskybacteria bacterium CG10_big_fil_rev_8_21_14_0_10_46_23]